MLVQVVCGGCSSQRAIRLTDVNVECTTRVCTYCVIQATDASIRVNEAAFAQRRTSRLTAVAPPDADSFRPLPLPPTAALLHRKQPSIFSLDSELTDGSVVQLWPQPVPDDEAARLAVARRSTIRSREHDPTMTLLATMVARALSCPVAFIGILDETGMWFKACVGWDRAGLPRDDCVAAYTLTAGKTLVVDDTLDDKHFHASELSIEGRAMRFYAGAPVRVLDQCIGAVCALDVVPHNSTTAAMTSTLEAVAKIVSEVLEQRLGQPSVDHNTRATLAPTTNFFSASLVAAMQQEGSNVLPVNEISAATPTKPVGYETETARPRESGVASECQWDSTGATSRRSYYLTLPPVPHEHSDKIALAIDLFHRLQSSTWSERHVVGTSAAGAASAEFSGAHHEATGSVKTFETYHRGRLFTRTNMRLAGDCGDVVTQLQNYEDARLYQNLFSHVKRRYKLSDLTWMDEMTFRPGVLSAEQQEVRVLSHWRQYPDGSNVIVAVSGNNLYCADEGDLLFGWFVAPCTLDDGFASVNVSSIVSQPFENQAGDPNLSYDLVMRIGRSAPGSFKLSPQTDVPSSNQRQSPNNQATHDHAASFQRSSTASYSDDSSPYANSTGAAIVALQNGQGGQLNDNERMMLDLLDKTISTQEILAAQQSEMAGVIDLHGAQLQRISTAIERVETMLADNTLRLRRSPEQSSRHSLN